jgi:hypothetical protein
LSPSKGSFLGVVELFSVKKQISSAHQTNLKLKLKCVLKLFCIFFTFSNLACSSLCSFQLTKSINASYIYCMLIKLMLLFLSIYAEILEGLNDTILFFCGQLWNPQIPFLVDVDFPLQQYNPTLSSDGPACLLPLVASQLHINALAHYLMHIFECLSYLHPKPNQLDN